VRDARTTAPVGVAVEADALGADTATGEHGVAQPLDRHSSEPIWVDSANAVDVVAPGGAHDVEVHLIRVHTDQELVVNGDPPASSHTAGPAPAIHARSEWGAAPPSQTPVAAAQGVRFAVVHHTVGSNFYRADQVPGIILGIQAYHQQNNGWIDIGYNFLVDAYGGIWEGRAGGIDRAVIGAHAGGFNTGAVGVALMGDYDNATPSDASIDSLTSLVGWKLSIGGADPLGSLALTAGASEVTPKYPEGTQVVVPTIVAHRDVGLTACPGAYLYPLLQSIRDTTAAKYPNVFGNTEALARAPGGVLTSGWAIDRSTTAPIYVTAYVDGRYATTARADGTRTDVGAAFPQAGNQHGFAFTIPITAPGTHSICLYGINDDGIVNYGLGCGSVGVDVQPFGHLDALTPAGGSVIAEGWAVDPDTASAIEIDVLVDGGFAGYGFTFSDRADIGYLLPNYGPRHGFGVYAAVGPGTHTVCVYGINVYQGVNVLLGCQTVTMGASPIGALDVVVGVPAYQAVDLQGWAIDPQTAFAVEIDVLVDGGFAGFGYATLYRSDIGYLYPGYGAYHGYDLLVPIPQGTHTVCVYAINVGPGANTALGCPVVTR